MLAHSQKRLMAFAGIIWFAYIIIHLVINLSLSRNPEAFNAYYSWYQNTPLLHWTVLLILTMGILLHVAIAARRQLASNQKRPTRYARPYPKDMPRWVPWGATLVLLAFIIVHVVQMKGLSPPNLYENVGTIFTTPVMLSFFGLAVVSLGAHLFHSLGNVRQTLGKASKQHNRFLALFLVFFVAGHFLIVLNMYLSLT